MSFGSTESLPFSEEAAGTGIEGGNGAAAATDPTPDPQVASSSDKSPGGDYNERLREGGDFAEQEIKTWERKFTKANSERDALKEQIGKVESLLPIIDQLGGSQGVIQSLERLGKLVGDPKFGPVLQQYEMTGNFSVGQEDPNEYVDPVEAELRGELQTVRQELAALRGDTLKQSSTLAQQRLRGHFQSAIKEFPFNEDELAKINQKAEQTMSQWSQTADGIRTLETLDAQSVRTLIRGTLDQDEWIDIVRRMDVSRHEERQRMATDAPARTATGKAQSAAKTAIEACREAFKEEGLDPHGRLMP